MNRDQFKTKVEEILFENKNPEEISIDDYIKIGLLSNKIADLFEIYQSIKPILVNPTLKNDDLDFLKTQTPNKFY